MDRERLLKSDSVRVGVVAGLGLVLGIYSILTTVLISKDGVFYIGRAQDFARDPLGVVRSHSPGYPLLLWVAHEAAGRLGAGDSTFSWIHVSQGVTLACRLLAVIAVYFLGKMLVAGSKAFWAAFILIVLPYPAQYGHDVLQDWPYVMFLALGVWLLYWSVRRRAWWAFAFVGLAAGAGYLVQPICAQLVPYGLLALAVVPQGKRRRRLARMLAGGVLLVLGFALPVLPYSYMTGALLPPQLRRLKFNSPPVIESVGGQGASTDPLEFEIGEGELLEIGVEVSDPQGDKLSFSLVNVPVRSRPVYELRLLASDARFVTISENEKNSLLEAYAHEVLDYSGIIYYAYGQAEARAGLEPVYRFWSAVTQRHFYTISGSEKDAITTEPTMNSWAYEGIAFYAFAEGRQPPDATPVRRLWSEKKGYCWVVAGSQDAAAPASDANHVDDGVAWYAHAGGEPPAGMSLRDKTLQWRPGPGQRGDYQVNLIVSDGDLESCQLVRIKVIGKGAASSSLSVGRQSMRAGLRDLPGGVDRLFDAIAQNLMVFFLIPWGLGLYYRMRYEADRLERVLTPAVIILNVGLILARQVWISASFERRYCLGLIVLTIVYVPVGLNLIAQWLSRDISRRWRSTPAFLRSSRFTFLALVAIGVAICLPKLLTPLYGDKRGYLTAAEWLGENTSSEAVIAVPDSRLSFYAGRTGLLYSGDVDPRQADYVVRIVTDDTTTPAPAGWSREYSVPIHDRRNRTLTIYKTHRRRD